MLFDEFLVVLLNVGGCELFIFVDMLLLKMLF